MAHVEAEIETNNDLKNSDLSEDETNNEEKVESLDEEDEGSEKEEAVKTFKDLVILQIYEISRQLVDLAYQCSLKPEAQGTLSHYMSPYAISIRFILVNWRYGCVLFRLTIFVMKRVPLM